MTSKLAGRIREASHQLITLTLTLCSGFLTACLIVYLES